MSPITFSKTGKNQHFASNDKKTILYLIVGPLLKNKKMIVRFPPPKKILYLKLVKMY